MFYSIEGILVKKSDKFIVIENHGLGFRIFVSQETGAKLPKLGDVAKLFLHHHVREDAMDLYGFLQKEEMELFEGPYRLDVSSPGVSRPLVFLNQYKKHTGRIFEVSYIEEEAVKKFKGKLLSIENEYLTFEINNEPKTLAFSQIKSARVKVSF